MSLSRLVDVTGMSESTMKRALKYLRDHNYIKKVGVSVVGTTTYKMLKIKRTEETAKVEVPKLDPSNPYVKFGGFND